MARGKKKKKHNKIAVCFAMGQPFKTCTCIHCHAALHFAKTLAEAVDKEIAEKYRLTGKI